MPPPENAALVIAPEAQALAAIPGAPRLSESPVEPLRTVSILDEAGEPRSLQVPNERPLAIFLDERELVTLMTLGAKPEWLVLGYLRNQRIVESVSALEYVAVDWARNRAAVKSRAGTRVPMGSHEVSGLSACGIGSGLAGLPAPPQHPPPHDGGATLSRPDLLGILEAMRRHDALHRAAGSVHSCALFRGTQLLLAVEDVSRHNGVDIVTGWMAQHGVAGSDKILFTTGRLTGEIVLKAAHNGIPIVVSRNGATALGIDVAGRFAITLVGRAVNRRFICYTGATRLSDA